MQIGKYRILITKDPALVRKAQEMRASIFFKDQKIGIDSDAYDSIFQHLLILDGDKIVGTYRLAIIDKAASLDTSYTQTEFDISALISNGYRILEVGRSCVHPDYRTGAVISCLLLGIGQLSKENKIDYLLGCASFDGCNALDHKESLSYIYNNHLSDDPLRPTPLQENKDFTDHTNNNTHHFKSLPPLIKGYIRIGAGFAKGISIDPVCDTTDMCVLVPFNNITERYRKRFIGN